MNERKLCYENKYTYVFHDEADGFIYIIYKGVFVGDNFKSGGLMQIEALRNCNVSRALYDLRRYPVSSRSNVEWILQEFIPGMIEAGLKHLVAIAPEEYYGRTSAEYLLQRFAQRGVHVYLVYNEADAFAKMKAIASET